MPGKIDEDLLADVRAWNQERAATERDTTRTRAMANPFGSYPPRYVATWACRGKCGATLDVTSETVHAADVFDRELLKRGEPPIDRDLAVFCTACKLRGLAMQAERSRKHVDALAAAIKQLQASLGRNPQLEREHIKRLEALGHPDVSGLCGSIAARRAGKKAPTGGA